MRRSRASMPGGRAWRAVRAASVVGLALWAIASLAQDNQQEKGTEPFSQDLVGEAKCIECHKDIGEEWQRVRHSSTLMKEDPKPSAQAGCEACHGPGREHSEAEPGERKDKIVNPKGLSPDEISDICLECHEELVPADLWRFGPHALALDEDIGCTTCHEVHRVTKHSPMLRESVRETCLTQCHLERGLEDRVALGLHHPITVSKSYPEVNISEGFLECVLCHNQHGSVNLKSLRASKGPSLCARCHRTDGPTPKNHKLAEWKDGHKAVALVDKTPCMDCHDEQAFCTECHGVPMPHPEGWAPELHKEVASFAESAPCFKCHQRDWCGICHLKA